MVIIWGGDTGADCLGTAHRQGALSVRQLEILPEPPRQRSDEHPWPVWPVILRTSAAHEEGGDRHYAVTTTAFLDDGTGRVRGLAGHQVAVSEEGGRPVFSAVPGSEFTLKADLVLLAMGFVSPVKEGMLADLGVALDGRGNVQADTRRYASSVAKVFACGDMRRGQSLVVWAIREGRQCAAAIDETLMGETILPR